MNLIDEPVDSGIRLIVIKSNLTLDKTQNDIQSLAMIPLLSLFAEMERPLSKETDYRPYLYHIRAELFMLLRADWLYPQGTELPSLPFLRF